MNVLALAPHPDDETIGCGGSLRLHASRGDRVCVVFLTSGELGLENVDPAEARKIREREAEAAAKILGVAQLDFLRLPDWFMGEDLGKAAAALRPVVERESPATIYFPHPGEWHPDHRAAWPILRAAMDGIRGDCDLRAYEVWTPLAHFDEVEDITASMRDKLRAVRCYRSQLDAFRYDRAVRGLNLYRGALAGRCRFAEVFGPAPEDAECSHE